MRATYLQSDYSGKLRLGRPRHEVLAGVDLAREEFNNYGMVAAGRRRARQDQAAHDGRHAQRRRLGRREPARGCGRATSPPRRSASTRRTWCRSRRPGSCWAACARTASTATTTARRHRRQRHPDATRSRTRLAVEPALRRAVPADRAELRTTSPTAPRSTPRATPTRTTPRARTRRPRRAATSSSAPSSTGRRPLLDARLALFHATKYNERNTDPDRSAARALPAVRQAPCRRLRGRPRRPPDAGAGRSSARTRGCRCAEDRRGRRRPAPTGELAATGPSLTPRHSGTVWTTYQLTPRCASAAA